MTGRDADGEGPVRRAADGVTLFLRVQPRARRAGIIGVAAEADGRRVLRVAVTAPPEDGKANDAVIALLAKAWKLPKRAFRVTAGATTRRKTLFVTGEPAALAAQIGDAIERTEGDT